MKKLTFLIVAIAATLLAGCQKDSDVDVAESATSLTLSLANTRTSLGDKSGTTYPVYWSEGDCIAINGIASQSIAIDEQDRSNASFTTSESFTYPISVTYPYTASSTAAAAKVIFAAEQSYTEGTFSQGAAPMCGYFEKAGGGTLRHLAGVLRLALVSGEGNITLSKVVITSSDESPIAGEFAVNCTSGALTPSSSATSVVTYTLPDNFTLSADAERVFYIALPATEVGDCTIEFVDVDGKKMACNWSGKELTAGIVREFKTLTFRYGFVGGLEPMVAEEDDLYISYPVVHGYVKDTSGNPISGVSVSDGFSVVATDDKGFYRLTVSKDTWYIYISIPSEYEIPVNEYGQPLFFQKYPASSPQYDFTLTPLAGGKEEKFALVTFGDPQVSSATALNRFNNEAVPGIKAHIDELSKTVPCYGITLGDIISNGNSTNSEKYRIPMRDGFAKSSIGMPVFQVMGNHDNTFFNSSQPIFADESSSTFELKAQRNFEDMYGPVNYSFNRGDMHIIGMRDIVYNTHLSSSDYSKGFLDSQWEWLKQDLALIPKNKTVVLCVHIPIYNSDINHTQDVLKLLNTYAEAHIMSGHTHIIQNYIHKEKGTSYTRVYEHNIGAVCGCWWRTNMCGDGAPNGFGVFIGEGNTFTDWYYSGYHTGMNTRNHAMRLYRGNAITGAAISGSNSYGTKGYYAFGYGENDLLANVYLADSDWTISVYEDGVYSGDMTLITYKLRPVLSSLSGDGSYATPFTPTTATSSDMYFTGLIMGVLGRSDTATGSRQACYHMYKYTLKNKDADIKVVATDGFGNKYTETTITEGTDYTLTKKP